MSKEQRSTNLIPAAGFRVLTCRISEEGDSTVFEDCPLIGWQQTIDPTGEPVDPVLLEDGIIRLGSELAAYQIAHRVFPSELNDAQRFHLRDGLEKEARYLEAELLKKAKAA